MGTRRGRSKGNGGRPSALSRAFLAMFILCLALPTPLAAVESGGSAAAPQDAPISHSPATQSSSDLVLGGGVRTRPRPSASREEVQAKADVLKKVFDQTGKVIDTLTAPITALFQKLEELKPRPEPAIPHSKPDPLPEIGHKPVPKPTRSRQAGKPSSTNPSDISSSRQPQVISSPRISPALVSLLGIPSVVRPPHSKERCFYKRQPRTSAVETTSHVRAYKETLNRIIIRENISDIDKPARPDPNKWATDGNTRLRVVDGPVVGAYLVELPGKYTAIEISRLIRNMIVADTRRSKENKGCRYLYIDPDIRVEDAQVKDEEIKEDKIKSEHLAGTPKNPNDYFFGRQWNLKGIDSRHKEDSLPEYRNVGGADFEGAWREMAKLPASAKHPVMVAIIDNGFAITPPAPNKYITELVLLSDPIQARLECTKPDGLDCHGTEISAVLGARTNNGAYLASALAPGWSAIWPKEDISFLALDYRMAPFSIGEKWRIMKAIAYAAGVAISKAPCTDPATCETFKIARSPQVINLSGAIQWPCNSFMKSVVDKALQQSIILVAATGNIPNLVSDPRLPQPPILKSEAPASCPGVIAVTGHNKAGQLNKDALPGIIGRTVSAPGEGVPFFRGYGWKMDISVPTISAPHEGSGTSFATPHVTAAVALMLAVRPNLSPAQALQFLLVTGDNPGSLRPRLNASKALAAAIKPSDVQGEPSKLPSQPKPELPPPVLP